MWSFTRVFRRSRDNWKPVGILFAVTVLLYWNYSAVPSAQTTNISPNLPLSIGVRNIPPVTSNTRPADLAVQVQDGVPAGENSNNQMQVTATPLDDEREAKEVKAEGEQKAVDKKLEFVTEKQQPSEAAVDEEKADSEEGPSDEGRHREIADTTPTNKVEDVPKPKTTGVACPVQNMCEDDKFSYYVKAGEGLDKPPVICYNNELLVGKELGDKSYGRGVNMVVIHPKFKTVMDVKVFDLYESIDHCRDMAVYLSTKVEYKAQILIASFDDMTYSMCKSVQTLLNQYGSTKIKELKFRDSFVLVGERALPGNLGIEQVEKSDGKNFPKQASVISGCATQPISTKYVDVELDLGYELENCGVAKCGFDEIEIHVSTATDSVRKPRLCIGNRYVFYPGLLGGRGFNVVELDPVSKTVIRSAVYDTYTTESSRLELFLQDVSAKNFLVVVVADDGSHSLKQHAKNLLKEFGFDGDLIRMRTALYFVGRRGLKRTPHQNIKQPDNPKAWPEVINERFCLPTEIAEATMTQVTNKARVEFCAKHDSFADFCFVHHKTEPLIPANKNEKYSVIEEVFDVPILVLGGVNNIALSHSLRALLQQPGLVPKSVYVAYSTMFGEDYKPFIKLFEFNPVEVPPISRYVDFLSLAFTEFWKLNSNKSHVIVIDDEIVPKTGFLWYMGHAVQAMKKDSTIGAASAWNPQGFSGVALNQSAVHIVADFPGQSFLISKQFYEDEIRNKEKECCNQRSIQQWFTKGTTKKYKYIVPEISRADYFTSTAYSAQVQPLSNMAMSRPRTDVSANMTDVPLDMDFVLNYNSVVSGSLKSAYYITEHDLSVCKDKTTPGSANLLAPFIPAEKRVVAVVYNQASETDYSSLTTIYQCFGLMYMDGYHPFGMYNGVTQLSLGNKKVFLVGTSSMFYKTEIQSLAVRPYIASF